MSLRSKILLVLASVAVLYTATDNVLQRFVLTDSFTRLERTAAQADVERVRAAVESEAQHVDELCNARARLGRAPESGQLTRGELLPMLLPEGELDVAGLDLLFACAPDGTVLFGLAQDPESRAPISLALFPEERILPATHPLTKAGMLGREPYGLLATEHGTLLASARPLRAPSEDPSGSAHDLGTLYMGRFLGEALMAQINERVQVQFQVWPLGSGELPAHERDLLDSVTAASTIGESLPDEGPDGALALYSTLDSIGGLRPEFLLRVDIDGEVSRTGKTASNYALLSGIGTVLLILFVLLRLLQAIVIKPLGKLAAGAVEIGRSDDLSLRVGLDREDEIGQLSRELDSMVDKLAESRAELGRNARLAGMSEIATGVIHNVGNVLNSVNVSATVAKSKTSELAVDDLRAVQAVLQEHSDDLAGFFAEDPRSQALLPFLGELVGSFEKTRKEVDEELASLEVGLEHIAELVRSQQGFTGEPAMLELSSVASQVDRALDICKKAWGTPLAVQVERDYEELPPLAIDKHKLTQILVNLLQNAELAIEERGQGAGRIRLRIHARDSQSVRVEVSDDGVGIPEENLARVFQHGFTTRPHGHGFGLHSAANAATEMNARLWAESRGAGHGATFVLELPLPAPVLAAA